MGAALEAMEDWLYDEGEQESRERYALPPPHPPLLPTLSDHLQPSPTISPTLSDLV